MMGSGAGAPGLGKMLTTSPAAPSEAPADDGGLSIAASDLIRAVKAGDVPGVEAALRAAHLACQSYESEEATEV